MACHPGTRLSSLPRKTNQTLQTILISLQNSSRMGAPLLCPSCKSVAHSRDWGISSAGRATGLQPVGQRFDPAILHQFRSVVRGACLPPARLVEPGERTPDKREASRPVRRRRIGRPGGATKGREGRRQAAAEVLPALRGLDWGR